MEDTLSDLDSALIQRAQELIAARGDAQNHTVAAAARSTDGRVVTGVNVYHFTGGPCAELVVLGTAVTEGVSDLVTIVAVGDHERGVLSPCGRCREIMLKYHPAITVIVPTERGASALPIAELLPP